MRMLLPIHATAGYSYGRFVKRPIEPTRSAQNLDAHYERPNGYAEFSADVLQRLSRTVRFKYGSERHFAAPNIAPIRSNGV